MEAIGPPRPSRDGANVVFLDDVRHAPFRDLFEPGRLIRALDENFVASGALRALGVRLLANEAHHLRPESQYLPDGTTGTEVSGDFVSGPAARVRKITKSSRWRRAFPHEAIPIFRIAARGNLFDIRCQSRGSRERMDG
jgi:hypothetical protein